MRLCRSRGLCQQNHVTLQQRAKRTSSLLADEMTQDRELIRSRAAFRNADFSDDSMLLFSAVPL